MAEFSSKYAESERAMPRTIEQHVQVERGRVIINLPADIPDGPAHVTITINTDEPKSSDGGDWLDQLQPINLTGWPAGATFGRDELYGDDGR